MIKKIKNKGFDGTSIHKSLANLCYKYDKRLYKSFGDVQSWVGGISIHAGLINRKSSDFVGSKFLTKFPHPAHLTNLKK